MSSVYIHLDSTETLDQYIQKVYDWKHEIYDLHQRILSYHASLGEENKWYGRSHEEFHEEFILEIMNKYFQPAAQFLDEECHTYLVNLKNKVEELQSR